MKGKEQLQRAALLIAAVFVYAACGISASCAPQPELEAETLSMALGESVALGVSHAEGASWRSSNEEVAYVDGNGVVKALFEGTAIVTVSAGGRSDSCTVTVTASAAGLDMLSLVWNDEFFGDALDPGKWDYQLGVRDEYHGEVSGPRYWGNDEQQYYTKEAVSLRDGTLCVTARREEQPEEREFSSGRILTRDKFSFTYGYAEARMKLPEAQGMWPAFWLLPQPENVSSTQNAYGSWAANGEIDVMEARGRQPDRVGATLHYGNAGASVYSTETVLLGRPIGEWHVYGVEWRETYIAWRIDGKEVFRVDRETWWSASVSKEENANAPFDQPFYLLLNLAVGGNYDGGVTPEESFLSAEMLVDYVRVYEFWDDAA